MSRTWLVRAGSHGERELMALDTGLAVIGWDDAPDMSTVGSRAELHDILRGLYPESGDVRHACTTVQPEPQHAVTHR